MICFFFFFFSLVFSLVLLYIICMEKLLLSGLLEMLSKIASYYDSVGKEGNYYKVKSIIDSVESLYFKP